MAVFLPVDMNDLDFVARANSSLRYNLAEDVSTQPQDGSSHSSLHMRGSSLCQWSISYGSSLAMAR